MSITPLTLGIFILIAVLVTFVVAPLLGTVLLWLSTKLWRFEDSTFKSSFKAVLIILGAMLATGWIIQILFVKGSFEELAQSSPQTFLWFLFISSLVGLLVGVIAIRKLFQESLAKSIGAAITFIVSATILFALVTFVITITVVSRGSVASDGQQNSAQTSTGVSSQQTIIAKQSTLLSGASMAFVVSKYPQNAASWSLRVDCEANTTVQLVAVASDLKTPVGKVVNCNEDIILDRAPYSAYPQTVIFSMKALNNRVIGDETLTIASKTLDATGTVLNQSFFPVTVQAYTEGFIKNYLARIVFQSDIYSYSHRQGGFTQLCTSYDPDGILSIESDLKNISPSVVCKDSQNAWAISVQLPSNPSQYWCADNTIPVNTFAPIVRNSAITTTSCK